MTIQSSGKMEFNEINITPLTDIFLVLLIIMMVIAPMFQTIDKDINTPKIKSGTNIENNKTTVAITKSGTFFLDEKAIDPNNLEQALSEIASKSKDKVVVVKADVSTKTKEIMKVMRAAETAGFEKLTVAGEQLSSGKQQELEKNAEREF